MKHINPKPTKHFLQRTAAAPGEKDLFRGKCGYVSDNEKEFTVHGKVTCPLCINPKRVQTA
jgi:hypothetical protein